MFLDELRAKGVSCDSIMLQVRCFSLPSAVSVAVGTDCVCWSHPQPLALDDVNKMVADVLHYGHAPQETLVLSTLVFEKTKGNPFFAISFLTKLYQTGLIVHLSSSRHVASHLGASLLSEFVCLCARVAVRSNSTMTKGIGSGTCPESKQWNIRKTWSNSWRRICATFPRRHPTFFNSL